MKTVERHSYDGNKIIKTRRLVFEPYEFSPVNMCLVMGLIQKNLKPIEWRNDLTAKKYVDVDTIASAACVGGACEIDF